MENDHGYSCPDGGADRGPGGVTLAAVWTRRYLLARIAAWDFVSCAEKSGASPKPNNALLDLHPNTTMLNLSVSQAGCDGGVACHFLARRSTSFTASVNASSCGNNSHEVFEISAGAASSERGGVSAAA